MGECKSGPRVVVSPGPVMYSVPTILDTREIVPGLPLNAWPYRADSVGFA